MTDLRKVFDRAVAGYDAAYHSQVAAYKEAEANGDEDGMASASMSLMNIQRDKANYVAQAQNHIAQENRNRPKTQKELDAELDYAVAALTPDEIEVAKMSLVRGTTEDKLRSYAMQKQKYHQMLANGSYSRQADNSIKRG
ncbi:hypothetical protein ACQR1Y_12460 [Bradyrhizobium sp. HKCCYLRH3099]|uniref:hypothetical protein n=1 Tax=Bradyrhizobium TaxID=374 RepID=UPI003EBA357D